MGENRGGGKVMSWPIEFHCAGVWFQLESILHTYITLKVKIAPLHTYTHTEERWRYSSNPSATFTLEAGGRSIPHSGRFALGEDPVSIYSR
jgi:hypothetical protein